MNIICKLNYNDTYFLSLLRDNAFNENYENKIIMMVFIKFKNYFLLDAPKNN